MIENMIRPRASSMVGQPAIMILSWGEAYVLRSHADVMSCSFGNTFKIVVSIGTRSVIDSPPVSSFSSNQMKMGTCLGCACDQVATMPRQASSVGQVLFGSMMLM